MNYFTQILILISMLTLSTPIFARSGDGDGPAPLVLSDDQTEYTLGQHMEILEDPAGTLTIQDVSSSEYSDRFIPSQVDSPNFGFTASVYWVRLRLRNESRTTDHWLLEMDFPNIHYVDLYLPSQQEGSYDIKQTGVLRPFNTRDIPNHHIVFNLPLSPREELIFYTRIQSGASMTLSQTLWEPNAFFQEAGNELFFLGIFYGMFLIMLVYNLFLLYSLRDESYLYFVCFLTSAILFFASYDALADQYIWPDLYNINRFSVTLFFILVMASITKFTDAFLETRTRNPKLHRVILFMLAGWGIAILLLPFVSYHIIFGLIAPFGVITLGFIAVSGIISWRRGYLPAKYFSFAWTGLIIGGILVILVRLNVIPSGNVTEQLYRLGMIWLMAFWAIALADRINLLKAEKEKANYETQVSEARFQKLVETMNEGLGITDEEGRYTYVNESLAKMHGRPVDDIIGHLAREFVAEENKQILTSQLEKRKAGATTPYELTWRRADGSDRFVIVSPVPVFESDKQFKGTIAVVTDITEKVQANRLLEERVAERTRELQDARLQISNLFNYSPLGIAIVTLEGRVLGINLAMQRITGYSEAELLEMNISTLYANPEQRESVLGQLSTNSSLSNYGIQLRRKNGSSFYANLNLSQLEMAGQPVLLGIMDDITEQVEAQETVTILHKLSYDLITITDLQTLIDHSVQYLYKIVDFQRAALMLVEEGEDSLTIYGYTSPTLPPELIVHQVPIDSWPTLRVVLNGQETSYVPDMQASEVIQAELDGMKMKQWAASLKTSRSWLSLPLLAGGRTIGLLNILHGQANYFDVSDVELARTFANQLAVAIDNIHLNEQTRMAGATEERSRIARELHDSVTQTLFTASVMAEATPRIWDKDQNIARQNMEKLSALIRGALAEMRSLLYELRSSGSPDQTLDQLLNTLTEETCGRSNVAVSLSIEGDRELPPKVTMTFYRIAREALNNVIAHAEATRVDITLIKRPDHVALQIRDDGRSFDPATIPHGHMGISIMAERAKKISGDFQIRSQAGHGTEIKVTWSDPKG
jgi:PAS domain S-box-containing protein